MMLALMLLVMLAVISVVTSADHISNLINYVSVDVGNFFSSGVLSDIGRDVINDDSINVSYYVGHNVSTDVSSAASNDFIMSEVISAVIIVMMSEAMSTVTANSQQ